MTRMRNSEGYFDPTAGIALRNVERTEKSMQQIRRGDIFYIEKYATVGSEQMAGRPALVGSTDKCNENADTIEIVYLTTAPKKDLPTHVTIRSTSRESTALCEQVTTVSVTKVKDYMCSASAKEMAQIELALLISLDLNMGALEATEAPKKAPEPTPQPVAEIYVGDDDEKIDELEKEVLKLKAQLDLYQDLYERLSDRFYGRAANA